MKKKHKKKRKKEDDNFGRKKSKKQIIIKWEKKHVRKVKAKFSTNLILKSFKRTLQQSIVFCEEIYNYNSQPAQY